MQSFGLRRELQAAKITEAKDRSTHMGDLINLLLEPSPRLRPSASDLLQKLREQGLNRSTKGGSADSSESVEDNLRRALMQQREENAKLNAIIAAQQLKGVAEEA